MSPIGNTSSTSSANAAAYKEYLANLQLQKQRDATVRETKEQNARAPEPTSAKPAPGVDGDGDSR